ncbi:MAG: hypothetical protein ACLQI7_22765 [Streptosporangiaceae bacterium]
MSGSTDGFTVIPSRDDPGAGRMARRGAPRHQTPVLARRELAQSRRLAQPGDVGA